jgi:hypothetical protein
MRRSISAPTGGRPADGDRLQRPVSLAIGPAWSTRSSLEASSLPPFPPRARDPRAGTPEPDGRRTDHGGRQGRERGQRSQWQRQSRSGQLIENAWSISGAYRAAASTSGAGSGPRPGVPRVPKGARTGPPGGIPWVVDGCGRTCAALDEGAGAAPQGRFGPGQPGARLLGRHFRARFKAESDTPESSKAVKSRAT